MSLKGFGLFTKIKNAGHDMTAIGLHGRSGDVVRLSNRLRIAKSFRGITLEGVTPRTTRGYDALMLAFLTHSALEVYLEITGQKLGDLEKAHIARRSDTLLAEVFDVDDHNGHLFDFLYARVNKSLQPKLAACRDKKCFNVGIVSSAIRHIFAHGHLTANPNRMTPERVYRICQKVSTFLVDFMDDDFNSRMREYAQGKRV